MTGAASPPTPRERCVRTPPCAAPSLMPRAAPTSTVRWRRTSPTIAGLGCPPRCSPARRACRTRSTRRSPWWAAVGHWAVAHHGFARPRIRALRRLLDVSEAALRRCPAAGGGRRGRSAAHRAAGGRRRAMRCRSRRRPRQARFLERRLHRIKEEHEAEEAWRRARAAGALEEEGGGDFAAGGLC